MSTPFASIEERATDFVRAIELTLEANDVLTTPLLPGLEMSLSRIFSE